MVSSSKFAEGFDLKDPKIYHDRILVAEGVKFYVCHKFLTSQSYFFRNMFLAADEANVKDIEMMEVAAKDLEMLIRTVYENNDYAIEASSLISMMELSRRFAAPNILAICKNHINNNFDSLDDLKLELLKTACFYGIDDLTKRLESSLMDENLLTKFNLEEVVECVIEYKLERLKAFIGFYKSKFLTVDNCCELLDYAADKDMRALKNLYKFLYVGISAKVRMWGDIPQDRILKLLKAAFKHDVKPLKDRIRVEVFCCMKIIRISDQFGFREFNHPINYFLKDYERQINKLPKEIREFVLQSTIPALR